MVHPLIKKLIKRPTARLLENLLQVVTRHNPVPVLLNVPPDRRPVQLRPQLRPDHVQHPRPLRIRTAVKLLHRLQIVPPHNRPRVPGPYHLLRFPPHAQQKPVPPVLHFLVQHRVVTRKSLVQPQMRPVPARQQIPEPLVRRLMRIQSVQCVQLPHRRRKQRIRRIEGAARVLHPTRQKIMAVHLRILVPRKRIPSLLLVKPDDRRRVPERQLRLLLLRRRHIQRQRQLPRTALQLVEIPRRQRYQIVHMRLVLLPVPNHHPTRILLLRQQHAVRNRLHPLRHPARHLRREPLIRVIITRKPVPVILRLTLRPHLRVPRRIPHLRRPEINPVLRLPMIPDTHRHLRPGSHRLRKIQHQLVPRRPPRQHLRSRRRHRIHRQINAVQLQLRQRLRDRLKRNHHLPLDRPLPEIRRHIQRQMPNVHQPVPRILPPRLPLPAEIRPQSLLPAMPDAIMHLLGCHRNNRQEKGKKAV